MKWFTKKTVLPPWVKKDGEVYVIPLHAGFEPNYISRKIVEVLFRLAHAENFKNLQDLFCDIREIERRIGNGQLVFYWIYDMSGVTTISDHHYFFDQYFEIEIILGKFVYIKRGNEEKGK